MSLSAPHSLVLPSAWQIALSQMENPGLRGGAPEFGGPACTCLVSHSWGGTQVEGIITAMEIADVY